MRAGNPNRLLPRERRRNGGGGFLREAKKDGGGESIPGIAQAAAPSTAKGRPLPHSANAQWVRDLLPHPTYARIPA
jgi:hypothetical protein